MSVSKNLFKSSMIYFVGQVLSKIISFLLLPLYSNYILKDAFGFYDLSISVLSVAVPVIFMEIWTGTLRFSLEHKDDEGKRVVINNSLMIGSVSLVLYSVIYVACAFIFHFDMSVWIYIYSFVWVFQLMLLSVTRAYGKNALYAYSGVFSVFINAIVTIAAVFLMDGSIVSLYLGAISGMLIQSLIINHKFKIFTNFSLKDYDSELCNTLIRFSLPLCLNSVMYWMLEGFNKFVMSAKLGTNVVGVYAMGNRISLILNLVISVFNLSWQETIFKLSSKEEKEQVYQIGFNMLIKIVGAGLVVLLPVISILFPYLIGQEYASSRNLIPFLLLVIFVNAVVSLLAACFTAEKDNKSSLLAKMVSCVVNVIVLFATMQLIGFYSSPLAMLIANLVGIGVQLRLLRKHMRIRPEFAGIIIFIVMFLISISIYMLESTLLSMIWFIIAGIFYSIYLKDFVLKILRLARSMLPQRS